MSHLIVIRPLAHVALLAVAASTAAQNSPRVAPPDPLDARAVVPAATYEPALSRYRPFVEPPPLSWRQANDTADSIGGWRAYAREAQGAASAPPRTPAVGTTP